MVDKPVEGFDEFRMALGIEIAEEHRIMSVCSESEHGFINMGQAFFVGDVVADKITVGIFHGTYQAGDYHITGALTGQDNSWDISWYLPRAEGGVRGYLF